MSQVRLLVGTKKGAFVLTADARRENWEIQGPHFAGWEIYHAKGSPADPDRLYASQTSGWFGQVVQRSNDGGVDLGAGRQRISLRRRPRHAPVVRRHAAPVGVQAGLAPRALALGPRLGLCRSRGRRAVPQPGRRLKLARATRAAQRQGTPLAAGRRRHGPAHHRARSQPGRGGCTSPSRRRAPSAATTPAKPSAPSTRA